MLVAFSFWTGILETVPERAITLYRPVGEAELDLITKYTLLAVRNIGSIGYLQ